MHQSRGAICTYRPLRFGSSAVCYSRLEVGKQSISSLFVSSDFKVRPVEQMICRRGKRRLYVALCARRGRKPGGSDTAPYHWALLVAPKIEQDKSRVLLYHAKERLDTSGSLIWIYEGVETSLLPASMILVCIMVAKILEPDSVEPTLAAVRLVQKDPSWNCLTWVENALEALERSGSS